MNGCFKVLFEERLCDHKNDGVLGIYSVRYISPITEDIGDTLYPKLIACVPFTV
jgi:hypothetical protein